MLYIVKAAGSSVSATTELVDLQIVDNLALLLV